MYVLTRSRPTAAGAPSRELGISSAPEIHEGTIVLSVRVCDPDAQNEGEGIDQDSTIILQRPSIWKYAFRARVLVGEFGRALVEGWWVVEVPWTLVPFGPLV